MILRDLPVAEWDRLHHTPLCEVLPLFRQDDTRVRIAVAEEDGEIVGCLTLFPAWHVDGLWIAPTHRKRGSVWRRLVHQMQHWVTELGVRGAVVGSMDDAMTDYLMRMGASPMPGRAFVWPLTMRRKDAA